VERCPLARNGLGSDLLAACPGYEAVEVTVREGPGAGLTGETCAHIATGRTQRGFAATCHHPDAEWVVRAAREVATTIPTRGRPHRRWCEVEGGEGRVRP
jgi:hypothetical protein